MDDLVENPLPTLERVYEHAGRRPDADTWSRVEEWFEANRTPPVHLYELDQFGLDQETVESAFDAGSPPGRKR